MVVGFFYPSPLKKMDRPFVLSVCSPYSTEGSNDIDCDSAVSSISLCSLGHGFMYICINTIN